MYILEIILKKIQTCLKLYKNCE